MAALNCWTVVVADGCGKPDWWDFHTRREARVFSGAMRAEGWREVRTLRKHNPNPAWSRQEAHR